MVSKHAWQASCRIFLNIYKFIDRSNNYYYIEMTSIEKKEAFLINCCVCGRVRVCVVEEKERNVREQAHKYSSVIKYNRLCINNK